MDQGNQLQKMNLSQDMDELVKLFETCFAGELANRGGDFGKELQQARRILPLLSIVGRFSANFRHLFHGFVWRQNGRIAATVSVQQQGNDRSTWEIGAVATHPDFRRRGLARKLVSHAMDFAYANGAQTCVLYVLAENKPAYDLYLDLGFTHYDSITEYKLEELPDVTAEPADGYTLRPMKVAEWQTRYHIAQQETPDKVQQFLPLAEDRFRQSAFQQVIIPPIMWLQKLDNHLWVAERNGQPVGYMILGANRSPQILHNLRLRIVPQHRLALAEPMLTLALETLQSYPRENLLLSVRTNLTDMSELLNRYSFQAIETQHWLGAKKRDR